MHSSQRTGLCCVLCFLCLQGRIPYQVFERMDFLWKASNCLRLASPAASRMYSLSGESSLPMSLLVLIISCFFLQGAR